MLQIGVVVLYLHDFVLEDGLSIFYLNNHVLSLAQLLNEFVVARS